jgi:ATP-binding cassette, subfamily C, bacterial
VAIDAGKMQTLLRRYLRELKIVRWRLSIAVALIVMSAVTEGLGVALLLPALQITGLEIGGRSGPGYYATRINDAFAAFGLRPTLLLMIGLFIGIVSVRAVLTMAQCLTTQTVQEQFCQLLRQRLYEAISCANWLFICRNRSSDLVHALTAEVDRVGTATYYGLSLTGGVALAGLYTAISFVLFPGATMLALGFCTALSLLLRHKVAAVRLKGEEFSDISARLYAAAIEHLQGLKTTKMYSALQRNSRIFAALNQDAATTSLMMTRQHLLTELWFEMSSALILGVALLVAIRLLGLSPPTILIMLVIFARVVPRAKSIQSYYQGFVAMLPAFATIVNLEKRCKSAAEPLCNSRLAPQLHSAVSFEKVSFTYPGAKSPVLHNLDLVIPAGKTTAIVGPSGAGKSTIADLLIGLMFPISGRVIVDNCPLNADQAGAWRDQIGYVSQETFLFHDTVRANLLWAQPNADESELIDALRLGAAEEFVARLPKGLDTVISDRGMLLSQGERQRLALARAILRHPSLLVLDEATNSLDSENETWILRAIEQLQKRTTVVLIAHRLSTIRCSDLIYVIEAGRVVESGDWTGLAGQLDGHLRRWCVAQGLAA